jgi:hypothetical protein
MITTDALGKARHRLCVRFLQPVLQFANEFLDVCRIDAVLQQPMHAEEFQKTLPPAEDDVV